MLQNIREKSKFSYIQCFGPVAQWLEQGTHNPLVAGSSPAGPTVS